jgi:hypothetical protein
VSQQEASSCQTRFCPVFQKLLSALGKSKNLILHRFLFLNFAAYLLIYPNETLALKQSRTWIPSKNSMEHHCRVIDTLFTTESIAPPTRCYDVIHIRCATTSNPNQWCKQQLEALQRKFTKVETIQNNEELQPMWKEMEGRLTQRRSRTLAEIRGITGRQNTSRTDEEVWLAKGMCREEDDENNDGQTKNEKG